MCHRGTETTEKTLVKEVSVSSVPLWQNYKLILLKHLNSAHVFFELNCREGGGPRKQVCNNVLVIMKHGGYDGIFFAMNIS